ncbi:hypothetical protein [Isoptericola croceus]|uniref:hypothetical protein n=1 Tax=Isoptericola croceus TaxID=3031406 RepID=UPI0023F8323C|nr:hypothetical protein [Isoptericola croceus]
MAANIALPMGDPLWDGRFVGLGPSPRCSLGSSTRRARGWPSYHLQPSGDGETLVRHRGKLVSYGVWRLGTPIWRRFAVKERTIRVDALKASFEQDPRSSP